MINGADSLSLHTLWIGSYTQPMGHAPDAKGRGIYTATLDSSTGALVIRGDVAPVDNPSYMAWDAPSELLFAVSESAEGPSQLSSYRLGEQGLCLVDRLTIAGVACCHVSSQSGRIFCSSYMSGSLIVCSHNHGLLSFEARFSYQGDGPNRQRQEASHIHQAIVSPESNWLYLCDLGSDKIWCHRLKATLEASESFTPLSPGAGPRHMVFHPTQACAYALCELNAELVVFDYQASNGALNERQTLYTLADEFDGQPAAAAIVVHPTGNALYVSNRQHNSISVYTIDTEGCVTFASRFLTGREPRDITLDPLGRFLLVAHQDDDSISRHRINPTSGLLEGEAGELVACPTPVNMVFCASLA